MPKISNQFNFHGTVCRINQLIGHPPEEDIKSERVTMACSKKMRHAIETRSDTTSRYLHLAVEMLESFIPHEGRITAEDMRPLN